MATIQSYLPYDGSILANFYAWTNGISSALSTLGWTRITSAQDPGIVTWANVQTALATYTSAAGQYPSQPPRPTLFPTIAAWSSSSVSYTGVIAGSTTGTANIVTYNGLTWICILNNTSSGSNAPGTSGGSTYWVPYIYEIWKSNDTVSSTFPIYIKFVYWAISNGSPQIYMSIGTSFSGNAALAGQMVLWPVASGGVNEFSIGYNSSTPDTLPRECNFCSNGQGGQGDLSLLLWRNTSSTYAPLFLVIDRSKDQNGNDTGAYITVANTYSANSGQQISMFAPGQGGTASSNSHVCSPAWGNNIASGNALGESPIFPVFPVVGYLGNPLLGLVCMCISDFAEGSLVNCVMYGTSHTFLMSKTSNSTYLAPTTNTACGIRWE